jgi:predicted lipoprotein with Yx(FWY)xxD motif
MTVWAEGQRHPSRRWLSGVAVGVTVGLWSFGCASSAKTASASSASAPGTMLSIVSVSGLGPVVVDARGYTVYLFTSSSQKNVPCDVPSGCIKLWPGLPLPAGVTAPKAGSGIQAALLGTMKLPDGETDPTYNGYLLYGFAGDTGKAESHGQGIRSFGGVWYAINASGVAVTTVAAAPTSSPSS